MMPRLADLFLEVIRFTHLPNAEIVKLAHKRKKEYFTFYRYTIYRRSSYWAFQNTYLCTREGKLVETLSGIVRNFARRI
jgi:hypothetical protein